MYIAILCISAVAICTGRVEAKEHTWLGLKASLCVAICTGRVEAKDDPFDPVEMVDSCNLHGACGGKGRKRNNTNNLEVVAICTGRVEAKIKSLD